MRMVRRCGCHRIGPRRRPYQAQAATLAVKMMMQVTNSKLKLERIRTPWVQGKKNTASATAVTRYRPANGPEKRVCPSRATRNVQTQKRSRSSSSGMETRPKYCRYDTPGRRSGARRIDDENTQTPIVANARTTRSDRLRMWVGVASGIIGFRSRSARSNA